MHIYDENIDQVCIKSNVFGYGALFESVVTNHISSTTEEYAQIQSEVNERKAMNYIVPYLQKHQVKSVLDVGCGVGTMVNTLLHQGYQAYGVDIKDLGRFWERSGNNNMQYFLIDPNTFRLPFKDNSLDFAYSLGVIEHVGTSDGHADRLTNYHAIRKAWLRELFRVIRPGGHLLVGGPNRGFPIDVAHGPDSRASQFSKWLERKTRVTLHKTWGDNFLWGYKDFSKYLENLGHEMVPQSVATYVEFSRVPSLFRWATKAYVRYLPRPLLGTGFNPWAMALIRKTSVQKDSDKS